MADRPSGMLVHPHSRRATAVEMCRARRVDLSATSRKGELAARILLASESSSVKDIVLFSATVVDFALLVTVHCAIIFGLARRRPRSRALVALVAVPLAPYWAFREGMRLRAGAWMVAALVYVLALASQRG
jgi:hypothetical protein